MFEPNPNFVHSRFSRLFPFAAVLLLATSIGITQSVAQAEDEVASAQEEELLPGHRIDLVNPGFEGGLFGWRVIVEAEQNSALAAFEAAQNGNMGLRVQDTLQGEDVTVRSQFYRIRPGGLYRLNFACRVIEGRGVNVFLRFMTVDREPIETEHRFMSELPQEPSDWETCTLDAEAPMEAAYVEVYVRTNKRAIVTADFDDFEIFEVIE
ncbi:MAG: hypothetical protein ACFCU3_02450 [Verrucomicrobiales bacterium]